MNLNISNLKEELINLYKNIYIYLENSSWFHYIKEKYEHLQPIHRKIINGTASFILLSGLLYYPFSRLYASWENMNHFTEKKHLIQELLNLSAIRRTSLNAQQSIPGNLKTFISQRSESIGLPSEQITITPTKGQSLKELKIPARTKSVRIELNNLNLKELINYAHQLETLNTNLKVVNMDIIESEQKANYFNAVYTLSLFSLAANDIPTEPNPLKKQMLKQPLRKKEKIKKKVNKIEKVEIKK